MNNYYIYSYGNVTFTAAGAKIYLMLILMR